MSIPGKNKLGLSLILYNLHSLWQFFLNLGKTKIREENLKKIRKER